VLDANDLGKRIFDEELDDQVRDLQIYKNAFVVVPCNQTSIVRFYSIRNPEEVYNIKVGNYLNTVALHPMVNLMVIGGGLEAKLVANTKEGNNVLTQFYDVVTKELVLEQEIHAAPTHAIRWSPDGLGLVSVSEDGSLALHRFG